MKMKIAELSNIQTEKINLRYWVTLLDVVPQFEKVSTKCMYHILQNETILTMNAKLYYMEI